MPNKYSDITREEEKIRLSFECAESWAIYFKKLSIDLRAKSQGEAFEKVLEFYKNHSSARPSFNI